LADFTWSNIGSLFPFVTLGSQDASLFEQVNKRAGSIVPNHVFVCNTLGQMAIRPDPMVTPSADRTTTVQATLTADDWSSIEYTHQRSPRFHWLRGEAILAHATALQAIFCDAPGSAPGQGLTATPHGEQLARTQDDLNNSEGNRYARLNAPETPFNVRLVSANGGADFGIEPAAMTWVKLTLSAAYAAQRGLSFTEARGLPLEINITYQYERSGLFRDTVMTWERETLGVPAVTYIQPETPPPAPSPPPYDPTPLTPVGGDGFGTFYAMGANKLVQTRSLGADSPIYSDISGSVTGTFYDWILDPWNPTKRGWLLTSDGIWRYTALDTAAPTIEHMLDNTTVQSDTGRASSRFWYKTEASISLENYITALVGTDGTGFVFNRCYSIRSLDGGDTWLYSLIDDTSGGGGRIHPGGGLAVCPRLVGGDIRLQMGAYRGETFVGENIFIYQSDDKGENWAQVKGLVYGGAPTGASCLIFPYHNNTSGLVAWVSFLTTGTAKQLFRTTDGWSSFSTPALPGQADGAHETFVKRLGIEIWPQDQDQVAIWNSENLLFKSTDGSTFTEVTYSGYVPATHGAVVAAGGFAYSGSRYYIMTANRYIFVSIDGGETWIDKSGNIRDIITSNITSGETGFNAAIVPLWVAE
jgi:hypothetical protein